MTISKNSNAPLVVIAGITGRQGGSVFKALSDSSKEYRIKGISRDASKASAKAYSDKGAEVVSHTLSADNKAETVKVFQGADYVFAVTNFWEHMDKAREIQEGKMIVDAVKEAKAGTLLWSGLPNYEKQTKGEFTHVDHFDGKAEISEYARASGIKVIDVQPAMYADNFFGGLAPRKQEDGSYAIFVPQGFGKATLSVIDIDADYGLFAQAAIEEGYKPGDSIEAVSFTPTGQEVADSLAKKSGKTVNIAEVPLQVWVDAVKPQMGPVVAVEFAEMLATHWKYGYYAGQTVAPRPKLARSTGTWQQYLDKNDISKIFA